MDLRTSFSEVENEKMKMKEVSLTEYILKWEEAEKKKDAAQLLVQKAETSEQSNLHTSHCGPITIFVQKIQKMGFEEKKGFLEPKLNFSSKKWNFGFLDKKS